jgi:hypothetical protein
MSIYDEIKETNVIAIPQGKAYKDTEEDKWLLS